MSEVSSVLGIGSRVNHPAYGDGVIIGIDVAAYSVVFMTYGKKLVGKEYDNWEIIEAVPNEETVSFSEAEKSLIRILNNYTAFQKMLILGINGKVEL